MAASKIAKIAENVVTKSISVSTKIGMKGLGKIEKIRVCMCLQKLIQNLYFFTLIMVNI